MRRLTQIALCLAVGGLTDLHAQGLAYIKAHYTKYEYRISMRDGVRLFTAVYIPKESKVPLPVLLTRTPYSVRPYGADQYPESLGPSEYFAKEGYIFAYQDVRGRYRSEGKFEHVRPHISGISGKPGAREIDETTDAWDTIDWLISHVTPNNGKAGVWGISYPGFYTAQAMIDAHPALAAVSPQAPVGDWFVGDDFHHNGTLYLAHAFRWFSMNDRLGADYSGKTPRKNIEYPSPDGYDLFLGLKTLANINETLLKDQVPYWKDFRDHPDYDAFWQARDLRRSLRDVRPAVLTVGGWFDAEDLFGTLGTFRGVEAGGSAAFNGLVMGPWFHGGWNRDPGESLGAVRFGAKTSELYREKIEFPFFQHFLKGDAAPVPPKAQVFETGANRWHSFPQWPPAGTKPATLYLREQGSLKLDAPPTGAEPAYDEYVSDPDRPVPYINAIANTMTREHMVDDQRFAAVRPDVLVFQTEPLEEDITLAGPLGALLYVSTSGTDSDWVVKLIDVYPDDFPDPDPNPAGLRMGGYQQLVRGEAFRGRYRNSYEHPEPFQPGKMEKIEYTLPDVFHNFRRGHRLMLQVQSSWFPLVDLNPQKFVDIYTAKRADFQKAAVRVYRYAGAASSLKVRILR